MFLEKRKDVRTILNLKLIKEVEQNKSTKKMLQASMNLRKMHSAYR